MFLPPDVLGGHSASVSLLVSAFIVKSKISWAAPCNVNSAVMSGDCQVLLDDLGPRALDRSMSGMMKFGADRLLTPP